MTNTQSTNPGTTDRTTLAPAYVQKELDNIQQQKQQTLDEAWSAVLADLDDEDAHLLQTYPLHQAQSIMSLVRKTGCSVWQSVARHDEADW
jgi:hypothetical protein